METIERLDVEIKRLEERERSAKSLLAADSYAYDREVALSERKALMMPKPTALFELSEPE